MIWVWIAIMALTAFIEMETAALVSIWFTFGSLVALILAACGVAIEIQCMVFAVVALLLLLCLRKITLPLLRSPDESTNADALIGERVKLLSDITEDNAGSAKFHGVVWSCVGEEGFTAKTGEDVIVMEIKGNKLVVKKGD